jgi:hypothetical protein
MERLGASYHLYFREAVAAKVTVPDPQTDDGSGAFVVHRLPYSGSCWTFAAIYYNVNIICFVVEILGVVNVVVYFSSS